jgi:hypothetical protein
MIYVLIKRILAIPQTSPILLTLVGTIFLMFGTCFGIALLGNYNFINVASGFFFVLALLVFIPALINYLTWKRKGLLQPFPNGTVVWQVDHIRETSRQRYRPLLSVREATTLLDSYQAVFTLPETGSQRVTIACATCQQEVPFVIDSLQRRRAKRISIALRAGIGLFVSIALGIWLSPLFQPLKAPDWVVWLRLVFVLLLFGSMGFLWIALAYSGVHSVAGRGHRTRTPEKSELERYVATLAPASGFTSQRQG